MNEILTRWEQVLALLPDDLEQSARAHGAFLRARGVPDAKTLLRLLLAYASTSMSFRQTTAWAEAADIAHLTDVGLIKRMKGSRDWLLHVISQLLAKKRPRIGTRRIRLVDATNVRSPQGELWRLHLAYDAHEQAFLQAMVTDAHTAESLRWLEAEPDALTIADRGYANPGGLASLIERHGLVLCRLKVGPYLAQARDEELVELNVPNGRVILAPIPKEHHAKIDKRLKRRAQKRQVRVQPDTIKGNHFLCLFCNDERLSAQECVELYRWRWQIELTFKRLKSLQGMDEMTVKDPILCETYMLCHSLISILVERLSQCLRESFPPESIAAAIALATLAVPLPQSETGVCAMVP